MVGVLMVVMGSTPCGVVAVWPTLAIETPLMVTPASPSVAVMAMVPVVRSLSLAAAEPAGSPPRAGRPASLTPAVAAVAPAGCLGGMMVTEVGRAARRARMCQDV